MRIHQSMEQLKVHQNQVHQTELKITLRKQKLENLDTNLGVRKMTDGTLKIGNQPIKINRYKLTVEDLK